MTTLTPLSNEVGGQNNYTSTSSQTISTNAAARASYNSYLRNSAATDIANLGLEYYLIDVASAVESGQDTSIWANNGGTAYTSDGVHLSGTGNTAILNSQQANIITAIATPFISNISAGTPSHASATVTWSTDENTNTQIQYGLTSSYSDSSSLDATSTTSHSVNISGLAPSTTYHYRVLSRN